MNPAPPTAFSLAWLLVGLRWRSWRGSLRAGPRVTAARFAAVFALVVPAAYVGLLATALDEIRVTAGPPAAAATLAVVVSLIVLASFASKVATGDFVVGRGGEIELLLAHPVSLPALVVARGLAAVLTDLMGALFLLPVLAAAVVVLGLGPGALALGAAISLVVQVAVTALALALQIAVVHVLRPGARRLFFVAAALGSAICVTAIWMLGSTVLRAPDLVAAAVTSRGWLSFAPGGLIAFPLLALGAGDAAGAALAALGLALAAALALAGAAAVARWAARAGWEQAGAAWAEAARGALGPEPVRPLGLIGKDLRLFARDRARLVTLLALPLLFVGLQIFGSAGWAWSTESAQRLAICAYSLSAYAATFGPLVHLESERRAFWILRAAPITMERLLVKKASFWAAALAGFTFATYLALALAAGYPASREVLELGAVAVLGAGLLAFLAVGLGAAEADLTDEARPALGPGTAYLFLLVSGLFNLALLEAGLPRLRVLALYGLATVVALLVGAAHARAAFDPEEVRGRRLAPVAGLLGLILLLLGRRTALVLEAAQGAPGAAIEGVWILLVGAGAVAHHLRQSRRRRGADLAIALVVLATLAAAGASLLAAPEDRIAVAIAAVAVEELIVRGIVQRGLAPDGASGRRRAAAALVAALLGLVVAPPHPALLAGALLPAAAFAAWPRLAPAMLVRAAVLLGTAWLSAR